MRSRTFIVVGFLLAAVLVISSAAAEIYKDENQGENEAKMVAEDASVEEDKYGGYGGYGHGGRGGGSGGHGGGHGGGRGGG
ncbi:hypothetical protein TIFTF001_001845, partial [Ficus carica]